MPEKLIEYRTIRHVVVSIIEVLSLANILRVTFSPSFFKSVVCPLHNVNILLAILKIQGSVENWLTNEIAQPYYV